MKNLPVLIASLLLSNAAMSTELFGTVDALYGGATVSDQSGKSKPITNQNSSP